MNSNLNFDIDTESLLLEPIIDFPCFSTAKKSARLLLDNCDSMIEEFSSFSSVDNQSYDAYTPVKQGEKYKEKARERLGRFKLTVDKLALKRRAIKEATEVLKQQVKELMDVPLVSRRAFMNINY